MDRKLELTSGKKGNMMFCMKKRTLLAAGFLFLAFCTEFFSNVGSLIASRGYFIPKESSLFTFRVTLENTGNGEYWLYGEDDAFYYYAGVMPYAVMAKDVPCPGLDKLDYRTWCGVAVPTHDGYPQ